MSFRTLTVIFCLALVTACNNPYNPQTNEINTYYDLEGLLKEQVVRLDSLHPAVKKTAIIDSIAENKVLRPDSLAWVRELEMFFQADINAPVLRGSYHISEEQQGALEMKSFQAIDKEKAGVEYLKVYFHQDALQKVEAFYKEKNALYKSQRMMTLNFQKPAGEAPLLASYEVKGQHKMIMKDPVTFEIAGELVY